MKTFLLTITLAVALAACGSGGEAVKTAGGGSTTTTVGLPTDPDEKALVESGTLQVSDLPPGFTQKPPEDDDEDVDAIFAKVPECEGLKERVEGRGTGEAKSPHFEYGDDVDVSNAVEFFATTALLDEVMGLIPAPRTVTCFQKGLQAAIDKTVAEKPSSPVKSIHITGKPMSIPAYGDGAVGIEFTMTIDVGRPVNLYYELVGVKVGQTLATFEFGDSDAHGLGTLKDQLIRTTVDRLRTASTAY